MFEAREFVFFRHALWFELRVEDRVSNHRAVFTKRRYADYLAGLDSQDEDPADISSNLDWPRELPYTHGTEPVGPARLNQPMHWAGVMSARQHGLADTWRKTSIEPDTCVTAPERHTLRQWPPEQPR